jgi:hypothetical protein
MTAAPALHYSTIEGSNLRFFRCLPYRATLSTKSCAERWNRAQRTKEYDADRFEKCRGCTLGAVHAGKPMVHYSGLYEKSICPRCRKFTNRMLGGTRCVSCYNREREFLSGKNAKGTAVSFRFDPRRIGVVIDGARVEIREGHTGDAIELALGVLRIAPGKIVFTRARSGPAITLGDLAKRYRGERKKEAGGAAAPGYRRRQAAAAVGMARRAP